MAIQDLSTHPHVFVSIADLATYWRVSRRYIYKQVELGILGAVRFGPRSFRISISQALEFERLHSSSHWSAVAHDQQPPALAQRRTFAETATDEKADGTVEAKGTRVSSTTR